MTITFLEFPQRACDRIFGFLDAETAVRMRKISKSIKELVDECTLRTQTPDIEDISVRGKINDIRVLVFIFTHWWYCRMWKNYIRSLMKKLAIKTFRLEDEQILTKTSLYFAAKTAGMQQFLEYLSHRVCDIKVDTIHLSINCTDAIRTIGGFLAGRSLKILRIGQMISTKSDL